jgi:hypothetical protein
MHYYYFVFVVVRLGFILLWVFRLHLPQLSDLPVSCFLISTSHSGLSMYDMKLVRRTNSPGRSQVMIHITPGTKTSVSETGSISIIRVDMVICSRSLTYGESLSPSVHCSVTRTVPSSSSSSLWDQCYKHTSKKGTGLHMYINRRSHS